MKRMWDENEIVELCKEIHNKLGIECIVVESLPSPEDARKGVIYLVPSEDGEEGNVYEEYILTTTGFELIGTTEINLSGYMTTDTEQTISVVKTFDTALGGNIKIVQNGVEKFAIYPDSNTYNTKINVQGSTRIRFDNNLINFSNIIAPLTNYLDIGSAGAKWRDLYLSGVLSDGTNSVSVEDLANLITYAKGQGWIS